MKRRDFITLLGGAAAAWPLAARAQQPAMPVIGFVRSTTPEDSAPFVAAFRRGLGESDYVEGQNVAIEYRYAFNQIDRLPALMAELVGRQVTVLAATGGTARAAKAATATIPIVFTTGDDPVKAGLVASLNRPGGNLTGVSVFNNRLGSKRLGLLHEMVPTASPIAILVNPTNPDAEDEVRDIQEAARGLGVRVLAVSASKADDLDGAFSTLVHQGARALIIGADAFLPANAARLPFSPPVMRCQPCGLHASRSRRAVSWATVRVFSMFIVGLASVQDRFSRVQSRPICRSSFRPHSIW